VVVSGSRPTPTPLKRDSPMENPRIGGVDFPTNGGRAEGVN
jgi:hypothetical protein